MSEILRERSVSDEWGDFADDLKASFVPITEIHALHEQLPKEAFAFVWDTCGWDGLVANYPELTEIAPADEEEPDAA